MNKKLVVLTMSLMLLVSAAANATTIHVKANIPLKFMAGRTILPAGPYELLSMGVSDNVLLIRSLNSNAVAVVLLNSCQSQNAPLATKLVFHRYDQRYFLSAVWMRGDNIGFQVPASSWEVEVARDFSMNEVALILKRN